MEVPVPLQLLWCAASSAAEPGEVVIDFGLDRSDSPKIASVDDDTEMADFAAEAKKQPPPPGWFWTDPAGKAPLADNFDVRIDALDARWLSVELPVLVAQDRASFEAAHPGGIVVIAEVTLGAERLSLTQTYTPDAILQAGPTMAWFQAAFPSPPASGSVRYLLKVGELMPPGQAPAAPPPPPLDKFARTKVFVRP